MIILYGGLLFGHNALAPREFHWRFEDCLKSTVSTCFQPN